MSLTSGSATVAAARSVLLSNVPRAARTDNFAACLDALTTAVRAESREPRAESSDALRLDLLDRQQWSLVFVSTDEPDSGWLVRDWFGDVVTNGHASPRLALDAAIAGLAMCATRAACETVGQCAGRCWRVGEAR